MIAGNITNLKIRSIIPMDLSAFVLECKDTKRFLLGYKCVWQGSEILNHYKPKERSSNGRARGGGILTDL